MFLCRSHRFNGYSLWQQIAGGANLFLFIFPHPQPFCQKGRAKEQGGFARSLLKKTIAILGWQTNGVMIEKKPVTVKAQGLLSG